MILEIIKGIVIIWILGVVIYSIINRIANFFYKGDK